MRSPKYYAQITEDFKSQVSLCSSGMSSPRALKESPALRDVILSQKDKIDRLQESESFLKTELNARE